MTTQIAKNQNCVVFYFGTAPAGAQALTTVKAVGSKWITAANGWKGRAWDGVTMGGCDHHLILTPAQAVEYRLVSQWGATAGQAADIMECEATALVKWESYGLCVNDAIPAVIAELFVWKAI